MQFDLFNIWQLAHSVWKLILLRIELCMQCLLCSLFFILHSSQDLYLGSGNLGSRCTTRTKEIGMLASKCPSLAMVTKRSHSMSKSLKKSHFASLRAKRAFFALDYHTKNYHHFRHENWNQTFWWFCNTVENSVLYLLFLMVGKCKFVFIF